MGHFLWGTALLGLVLLLALPALARCLRLANALPVPCLRAACARPALPARCSCTTCSARPLPRAPLLPASSPCPARSCCPRATPCPAHPLLAARSPCASAPRSPKRQRALLPSALARPAAQRTSAPRSQCTSVPHSPVRPALPSRAAQPCRAAPPSPSRAAQPEPSRPAATSAAAAGDAAAAAADDDELLLPPALLLTCRAALAATTGTTTVTALASSRGGQQQSLPLPDNHTPQQLREWVIKRGSPGGGDFGFMEAASLGSSESATTPGASVSSAALGARQLAAALGASSAFTATGPASAEALCTFTLDSGASHCFFRDCTTITPLAAPVPVSLADPTGRLSSRASLHCPPDEWVDTFIRGGQRVAICTCSRTDHHLATFTRQPGSGLYTLTTASPQVAASGHSTASSQVSVSSQLAASCSYQLLSHQTLLWHHCLRHPSLPRLRSMHSRLLVSGLPRSLPPLPRSPAPPCLPCVEGRQRAAPHSSEFPPTTTPMQTLRMDV
ncbi:unnamed protein product [Closterium sp. NIES-54]